MSDEDKGPVFWMNVEALQGNRVGLEATGAYMDLLVYIWHGSGYRPFVFDPEAIAAKLNAVLPRRDYSAALLRRIEPELRTFFTVLEDGRWAPSPEFISLTDGNAEARDA